MSTPTLTNKFIENVDIKTIYLVYGYIRILEIEQHRIPSSIINLCVKFYHTILKLICLQKTNQKPPIINIADLDGNYYHKFNEITPLKIKKSNYYSSC